MKELEFSVSEPRAALNTIRTLSTGGVALLPTDTLYGLHALATLDGMPARLAALKGYESSARGFILLVRDGAAIEPWAELDDFDREFMKRHCPGPVSMIFRARPAAPAAWTTAGDDGRNRIAFRIPKTVFMQHILEMLGEPILSTSANLAGEPPLESLDKIAKLFDDKVKIYVCDPELERRIQTEGAAPSALIDMTCRPPKVIREGATPFVLSMKAT